MFLRNAIRTFGWIGQEIDRTNLGLISAGCAFFGIIAIFPASAAIIAIFALVADPTMVMGQLDFLNELMPQEAFEILQSQMQSLMTASTGTLTWTWVVSLGVALWSTRSGIAAVIRGLNGIHRRPNRTGFKHVVVALTLTVILIAVAVVALLLVVLAPLAFALLPPGVLISPTLDLFRWLLAFAVIFIALGLLYRYGPNARTIGRPGFFSLGALFAVICWLVASVGFSTYLANFGNYNRVYGSIGAVIALLFWLYLSAYLILLGAIVNRLIALWGHPGGPVEVEEEEEEA